jgi:hypothetical protein
MPSLDLSNTVENIQNVLEKRTHLRPVYMKQEILSRDTKFGHMRHKLRASILVVQQKLCCTTQNLVR